MILHNASVLWCRVSEADSEMAECCCWLCSLPGGHPNVTCPTCSTRSGLLQLRRAVSDNVLDHSVHQQHHYDTGLLASVAEGGVGEDSVGSQVLPGVLLAF